MKNEIEEESTCDFLEWLRHELKRRNDYLNNSFEAEHEQSEHKELMALTLVSSAFTI